jgi:hypothetical protein
MATRKSPSSRRKKKPWQNRSKYKVMLELIYQLIWNCSRGIYPRSSDCKQATLQGDPSPSMSSICRKHPEFCCRKNWLLLHNNAPAHRSVPV